MQGRGRPRPTVRAGATHSPVAPSQDRPRRCPPRRAGYAPRTERPTDGRSQEYPTDGRSQEYPTDGRFAYNVDAFLAAARSVLDYAYTHVRAKDQEAGHEDASRWYEEAVGAESTPGNDLSEPLRLLRNESIHQWPVRISWHEDKYYFHAPNLPGQDVLTLCETHLTRLEDILAEGREKGHLPGRRVELIPIEDGNPTVRVSRLPASGKSRMRHQCTSAPCWRALVSV